MKRYTCIVVDDETLARELLCSHIKKIPQLQLLQTCHNAIDAKFAIDQHKPDILFLDINMPNLSGIELLKMLPQQPATILTTAHDAYAIESYEFQVLDYLLKPIEFERFFKAVNKAIEWHLRTKGFDIKIENTTVQINSADHFYVKSDNKILKVVFDEILFIEALQKYVRIQTNTERIITLMSMSQLEEILPPDLFFRIHRSYIINTAKIDSIEGNMIHIQKHELPLSKAQRESFLELLRSKTIGGHKLNW